MVACVNGGHSRRANVDGHRCCRVGVRGDKRADNAHDAIERDGDTISSRSMGRGKYLDFVSPFVMRANSLTYLWCIRVESTVVYVQAERDGTIES